MGAASSGRHGGYALLLLRVVVGIVFVAHGYPLWTRLGPLARYLASLSIPAPAFFAPVLAFVETFGGLAMILGVLTRYAGLALAATMAVSTLLVKTQTGLIAPMDRPGPPGAELDLTLLAASLTIAAVGPGAVSLAGLIGRAASQHPKRPEASNRHG
jgi:putative oxidoreductase